VVQALTPVDTTTLCIIRGEREGTIQSNHSDLGCLVSCVRLSWTC